MIETRDTNPFIIEKMMGCAESFRELAKSLGEEFQVRKQDRQSLLEDRRLWENRQVISNNLTEVADIMTKLVEEELCYERVEDKKRKKLIQALKSEGIFADDLYYFTGKKGKKVIGMTLSTLRKGGISTDDAANILSVLLKKSMQASVNSPYLIDRRKNCFLFVEEPSYIALSGFCRATKETESISGDNYAIVEAEKGRLTVLLSDGTGSGERACADSERVLDLMEKMLEAGFCTETAINMANAAIFARGEEGHHPTLDLCNLDLDEGSCDIYKIGGAATFLKRENEVEIISQGNLPLGIFQSVEPEPLHYKLQDGDYLILMTDGVLDALEEIDCEEAMAEAIGFITEKNPQEIAHKLLQLVIKSCGGHILDDMTILVIGIWEN
ncbi:MAG: SpoIIE family protein phosphatase [Lachnospiraceae bacterium]|nr:SpoIIE family protein phosphatase [Lachnospiraceae bacterium]